MIRRDCVQPMIYSVNIKGVWVTKTPVKDYHTHTIRLILKKSKFWLFILYNSLLYSEYL